MDISVKSGQPEKQRTTCLIVGIFERRRLTPTATTLDKASGGYLARILRRGDMDGRLGQTHMLHDVPTLSSERVLLVGCGKEREFDATAYRKAVVATTTALSDSGASDAVFCLTELTVKDTDIARKIRIAAETVHHCLYRFDRLKSEKPVTARPLRKLAIMVTGRREQHRGEPAVREANAIAAGVSLARDLGNLPGNLCTPNDLAGEARKLARSHRHFKTTVLEQKDMEALGMGALLSVARGSRQAPKLIIMAYTGGTRGDKPFVLIGKGITFDAGGISIKPAAAMDEMKFDMCGAASVFGTLHAVATLRLPINVVGIIPSAENLPDGNANKPGDIVTSMSGQTIEVLNTDAEGRLVLCDALSYSERFEPRTVIDIATLTGACVIALGKHASGLLGNHPSLNRQILEAGMASGDRAWELPLWDDYQEQLKSNFADMANIGGREAGTITAACFLARFARKQRWAHLDIAGTAWDSGANKGATGRPVPLLTQYLLCQVRGR